MGTFLLVEIMWFRKGIKEGFTLVIGDFSANSVEAIWKSSLAQELKKLNDRLQLADPGEQIQFKSSQFTLPCRLTEPYLSQKMGTVQLAKEAERRFAVTAGILA